MIFCPECGSDQLIVFAGWGRCVKTLDGCGAQLVCQAGTWVAVRARKTSETPRDTLLARLRAAARPGDRETTHIEADQALLEYIDDPEIGAAYEAVQKWYA